MPNHGIVALAGLTLKEFAFFLIVFVGVLLIVWLVPKWQAAEIRQSALASNKDKIATENELRRTVVQILGGTFFLFTLYFTWQSLQVDRQKEVAAERGKITDRFTQAVDRLGFESPNAKVGGIYELEQIARESPKDYQWTVTEILASFIRQSTRRKDTAQLPIRPCDEIRPRGTPAVQPEVDVQAAIEVIGRRHLEYTPALYGEPRALDLRRTDLRGANLTEADLQHAALTDSNLEGASIAQANLQNATLRGTDLICAFMPGASLEGADLTGAHLEGAILGSYAPDHFPDATGLTCAQIKSAFVDGNTVLPSYLRQQNCLSSPLKPIPQG